MLSFLCKILILLSKDGGDDGNFFVLFKNVCTCKTTDIHGGGTMKPTVYDHSFCLLISAETSS